MSKNKLYVILAGGNIGDPIQNIKFAEHELIKLSKTNSVLKSSLYKTQAWGNKNQADFYNRLFVFKSLLPPVFLLNKLLEIERKKGRIRKEKWGTRTLDLDLLYCENKILNHPILLVPHPEIQNRRFCLIPLAELMPDFIHPVLKKSNKELLTLCKDTGHVEKY